ncbi:MAG: TetR/AcrR family transcriptional regulator [Deltaproteobacteria bacterium]|nr:TetR/AcrR family transcriptional regulator [Deltaproteobacteria bacterium]MBW2298259.1 TetR/AcrR family transcriptional regulator [Deltaproteobacteria bacterium]MBW2678623.1 TetR/AcrR family transcriptional regulator [Deltaproteobacteria bacterium]
MENKISTLKAEKKKPAKKATHLKILKAARKIFAQYAYHAASIRMIGKEAGIDHPLISYYFPSKAILFEAVLADIVQEWHKANVTWFKGLDKMGLEAGLSLYIDRMLDYSRKRPYAAQVFLLNMVQAQDADTIPGYQAIQKFFDQSTQLLKSLIPIQATDSDIENFTQSFNTLAMSYVGAKSYYAGILGIPVNSRQYKKWVKDMLMDLFLPRLKQLMFGKDRLEPGA